MPDAPPPPGKHADAAENDQQRSLRVRWLASDRMQTLANVLTIIVAVAAIALSVWEGFETRKHNRLSVLPQLEPITETRQDGPSDTTIVARYGVLNTGLGPAVLQNVVYLRDGEVIFDTDQEGKRYTGLYSDVDDATDSLPFWTGIGTRVRSAGEMLEAGEEHLLVQVGFPATMDSAGVNTASMVRDRLSRYSYVFCYCSVYGEDCGQTHLGAAPPKENVCGF